MSDAVPAALRRGVWLLVALIGWGAVMVAAMVVLEDSLIRAWAEGNDEVRPLLEAEGLDAVKNGSIRPPQFIAPAITFFIVISGLIALFAAFLRLGFEWGRIGITVLLVFSGMAAVGGIRTAPPATFVVGTGVAIAIALAALACLWWPTVTPFLHPERAARPSAGTPV